MLINDGTLAARGAPSITINDVTVTEGNTGTVNATFTLRLSAAYGQPVTIHYQHGGRHRHSRQRLHGRVGGRDLRHLARPPRPSRSLCSATGRRNRPRHFVVNLSAPINATIADGQGIGTILDDEPRISINDVTVTEGNTGTVNATFTVTLSVAYNVAVTVHYAHRERHAPRPAATTRPRPGT